MKRMLLLAAAVALLGLACFNEEESAPPPKHPEPSSPVNVLKNVGISFNQRYITLLEDMLSEDFVFYFDPRDVGQTPPGGSQYVMPESWNRAEFLRAVNNLYAKAHRISLSITTENVGEPRPEATEYYAENVPTELLVMVDELNGFLPKDPCDFEFERYLTENKDKYWLLTTWQDGGGYFDPEPAPLSPTTIGRILAFFYTR